MTQSVIICEGFHDRAFLKGWLEKLDWRSPSRSEGRTFCDSRGEAGRAGHFVLFRDRAGVRDYVRIAPVTGDTNVLPVAGDLLLEDKPLDVLICVLDSDQPRASADPVASRLQAFTKRLGPPGTSAMRPDGGSVRLELLVWCTAPSTHPRVGLPATHTLELVAIDSIVAAYPARAAAVENFIAAQPLADPTRESAGRAKEHAWAYMAKWSGSRGCDEFYQGIWDDAQIAAALEATLRSTSAWDVLASL